MKKIFCFISIFVLFITCSFSVSADTQNVLVYEFNAEWFVKRINNNYPGYVVLTDDGCCTVVQFKSGAFSFYDVDNKSLYYLKPESTYFYTIDGEFNIYSNDLTVLKPNVNFTGVRYMSFGLKGTGRKVKSVKVYEVVEAGFGHGGLAGNSSDIHYGVEVITDVFSKLWNVLINYWWVMVGLCLPIAFYLLCIISDFFFKVPKGRFKPKLFSIGYYSGKIYLRRKTRFMTLRDKLMIYIYRKSCIYEQQKKDLDYMRRYAPMDSLDMYEAMRQDVEIECFNHMLDELMQIVLNCK